MSAVQAATDIHARAILVSLSLPMWSGSKKDTKVGREATAAHGAHESAGTFTKHLIPKNTALEQAYKSKAAKAFANVAAANSFQALKQHMTATRVWHYEQTLRWSDGWQLLPIKNYQAYTDGIRERQHTFNTLLDEFVADYPALREAARVLLNGMFNEAEYPISIRKRFSMTLEFNPVPSGTDFRVALADAEIEAIIASTENRVKTAVETATKEAAARLADVLNKMAAALSDPDRRFNDSLVENVRDLCGVLKRLNVADDPNLERLRRDAELLAMSEPETLRKNDDARAETAARAQSILDEMTATFGKGLLG
jgi:hypothetical protein